MKLVCTFSVATWSITDTMKIVPLLTYKDRLLWDQPVNISKRDNMYRVKSIEDSGDPCGVPPRIRKGLEE